MIPSMHDSVKSHVAQLIDLEPHISITTDIWSSDSLDSYISFTAHWINKDWSIKRVIYMHCRLMKGTLVRTLPICSHLVLVLGKSRIRCTWFFVIVAVTLWGYWFAYFFLFRTHPSTSWCISTERCGEFTFCWQKSTCSRSF